MKLRIQKSNYYICIFIILIHIVWIEFIFRNVMYSSIESWIPEMHRTSIIKFTVSKIYKNKYVWQILVRFIAMLTKEPDSHKVTLFLGFYPCSQSWVYFKNVMYSSIESWIPEMHRTSIIKFTVSKIYKNKYVWQILVRFIAMLTKEPDSRKVTLFLGFYPCSRSSPSKLEKAWGSGI